MTIVSHGYFIAGHATTARVRSALTRCSPICHLHAGHTGAPCCQVDVTSAVTVTCPLVQAAGHDAVEGRPEVCAEHRVDDGVGQRRHVSQPHGRHGNGRRVQPGGK